MMKRYTFIFKASFLALLLLQLSPVWAHPGGGVINHFGEGFVHPWLGPDHLMAMFAIGLWARSAQTSLQWQLPLCFWLFMAIGTLLPDLVMVIADAKLGIASSLAMLGLCLALNKRPRLSVLLPLIALSGICHGAVHAVELQLGANQAVALSGLLAATALIHLLGMASGYYAKRYPLLQRLTGLSCMAVVALAG
jgi:urease accessory protein